MISSNMHFDDFVITYLSIVITVFIRFHYHSRCNINFYEKHTAHSRTAQHGIVLRSSYFARMKYTYNTCTIYMTHRCIINFNDI